MTDVRSESAKALAKRKKVMEKAMFELVKDFEFETGLNVKKAYFHRSTASLEDRNRLTGVYTKVSLDIS